MARDLKVQKVALDAAIASHGKVHWPVTPTAALGMAAPPVEMPNNPEEVVKAAERYVRWLNDGLVLADRDELAATEQRAHPPARIRPVFTGRVIDAGGGSVTIGVDRDTSHYPELGMLVAVFEDRTL